MSKSFLTKKFHDKHLFTKVFMTIAPIYEKLLCSKPNGAHGARGARGRYRAPSLCKVSLWDAEKEEEEEGESRKDERRGTMQLLWDEAINQ